MATVQRWTGTEVRALREAKRMSIREFAAYLGVSERMISKWEAGRGNIRPRPVNQAALDTAFARCDPDAQARFVFLTGTSLTPGDTGMAAPEPIGESHVRHPVDGRLMAKSTKACICRGPGTSRCGCRPSTSTSIR